MSKQPFLLDAEPSFENSPDGLIIRKDQEITNDLLDSTAEARSFTGREGEFMHVAAVPTIVVEIWKRQGFDIMSPEITSKDIVRRLRKEGLDDFIATGKRV